MNSPLTLPSQKVTISPIGLQIDSELTFDEWKALAGSLGQAARSISFIVGDWLVYGQGLFGTDVRIKNAERVGAFDEHLVNRHGELLPGRSAGIAPIHERFSFQQEFFRLLLDGENFGYSESGDKETAGHAR